MNDKVHRSTLLMLGVCSIVGCLSVVGAQPGLLNGDGKSELKIRRDGDLQLGRVFFCDEQVGAAVPRQSAPLGNRFGASRPV